MKNFWDKLPRPFFVLAPMEAVTDIVFRQVIKRASAPDVFFSEFTNATGWVHAGEQAVRGRLLRADNESPIVAQIWGGQPQDLSQLAKHCKKLGYDGIDINMGCPAKSAIKSGGAALIRQPELAISSIQSAKSAGLPVSVKTRLGYSRVDEWRQWLTTLLQQDIVALTVHLRTKKEMSKVEAHWDVMSEIVALRDQIAPQTLIIGNGDVRDRSHGLELVKKTGCDGVMIGRGVFHNPYCFAEVDHKSSRQDLLNLLYYHLDLFDHYEAQTKRPFDTLKRFFKIYVRDFDGAHYLRDQLMQASQTSEVRQILDSFISDSEAITASDGDDANQRP